MASSPAPRPHGKPLAVSDFGKECEALINSKRTWEAKTAQDVRVVVETFAAILAEHGVSDVSEIEQFHVGRLRQHFDEIPARYGQSARMRRLSPKQLRETAANQMATATERNQPPPQIGLGVNTIRKHLGNLGEFLRFLRARGYALRELTLDGLRPAKLKSSDIRTLTTKPGPDRLSPMFRIPVFTGCLDADNQASPGEQVYHSANYFVPMLLTYLGARRNEITGLAAKDVSETENGWAIEIRINQFHRVKNVHSIRMLPVPDEVLRLGFVPYVRAIRDLGYQALFPELHHPDIQNDHGDRFYDDFKPLVEASDDVETWDRFLHALRHGQADTLKQSGVSPELINDISGRLNKDETSVRYTNVAGLPLIRVLLQKYPNITTHIGPRPLQLLPWVANRQPAPWTARTRAKRLEHARAIRSENARKRRSPE
jgi:integrase